MQDYQKRRNQEALAKLNLKNFWHLLAVGLGSGLSPKAPGTCGSLAMVPVCALLLYTDVWVQAAAALLIFILGIKACHEAEQAMGMHDHSSIVVDEFCGMAIAIIGLPQHWAYAVLAFVCFRVFDILKPPPVSYADQKIGGGLGVMVDDVLAGIYALAACHVIVMLLP